MKLDILKDKGVLRVQNPGDDRLVEFEVSLDYIHQWYPFNINYVYMYSFSRESLYLTEIGTPRMRRFENTTVRTNKKMTTLNGEMCHKKVMERNLQTIEAAKALGLPEITGNYTPLQIQEGFEDIRIILREAKDKLEDRYGRIDPSPLDEDRVTSDVWDKVVYDVAGREDLDFIEVIGEIYTMMTLMRKIAKERVAVCS